MPGVFRCDRGDDTRVLPTLCARGCGCNGHPAFPTPSVGRKIHASTRAQSRRGNAKTYLALAVIRRSDLSAEAQRAKAESDEAIHTSALAPWIASLALATTASKPLTC